MNSVRLAALALLLMSCGPSPKGDVVVQGKPMPEPATAPDAGVPPKTFEMAATLSGDAGFTVGRARLYLQGDKLDFIQVWMGSSPELDPCSPPEVTPDSDVLVLAIGTPNADVRPGTYAVDNGAASSPEGGVSVLRGRMGSAGTEVLSTTGAGTIELAEVSVAGASGTFDVTMDGVGPVSGSFTVPACPSTP